MFLRNKETPTGTTEVYPVQCMRKPLSPHTTRLAWGMDKIRTVPKMSFEIWEEKTSKQKSELERTPTGD